MEREPEHDWIELVTRKDEFLHILRILNHYYEMQSQTKNQLYQFRRNLVASPPEKIVVLLSKMESFSYFVKASLDLDSSHYETWIHIDGIAEEREKFKAIGNLEHPVFSITCLGDLYDHAYLEKKAKSEIEKKVAGRRKKTKI